MAEAAGTSPSIGLALGGGGARGLAHILVLEAFDELGLKPSLIAGTSIGAIYGAAYAMGLSGAEIRQRSRDVLSRWSDIARHLFTSTRDSLWDSWKLRPFTAALIKPVTLLEALYPDLRGVQFSQLEIPLETVATDFHRHAAYVMHEGPVLPAVAASIALPALFRAVEHDGRVLLDGGMINPVPFDLLQGRADIVVACDVLGGPADERSNKLPTPFEIAFAGSQIMQNAIVGEKLRANPPDIFLRPKVEQYRVLQFHLIDEILASAAPLKDKLKRALDDTLSAAP